MKNAIKLLGIIAIIALIGLSFAGCDTGGDSPAPAPGPSGPAPLQKTVYTWNAGEDSYRLEVTEASNSRAVYTPKSGDTYVLTITPGNKKSSGTVTVTSSSGDKKSTLTLTPTGASEPFTVTVTTTATNALVTDMAGSITFEGETEPVNLTEKKVTPVKEFETFNFKANIWYNSEKSWGEAWGASIPLSDFTAHIPQKEDKLTFSLSGTIDQSMQWFNLEIHCLPPWRTLGWSNYSPSSGWGNMTAIPSGYFTKELSIYIVEDSNPDASELALDIINHFWQVTTNDGLVYSNDRLPEGTKEGDVMATIRNFRISLEKIE